MASVSTTTQGRHISDGTIATRSFLLPSPLIAGLGANKNMRLKGSDRPRRQRASRFQAARSRLCPICGARHGRDRRTVLFPPEIEAIRPILGNAQSRSSSTIIRSMFVSFLAILNNDSRNGSEVVCCALMPKAV